MKNTNNPIGSVSKKIVFFTKYDSSGASSRYRTYQYFPYLSSLQYTVSPLLTVEYMRYRFKRGRLASIGFLTKAFSRRIRMLVEVKQQDLVFIEYELMPYFSALLERWLSWRNISYIVDYDDAIFHQYDQHSSFFVRRLLSKKISKAMRLSSHVIVGNSYLAEYARSAGAKNVTIIPTVIDLENYKEASSYKKKSVFTIVWIGSPSTTPYLKEILPALQDLSEKYPLHLRLIGASQIELPGVSVERLSWQEDKEVEYISQCHVGIMPLPDERWTRGKCGFKLIQYMACSMPVIASPVGVNTEIVEVGENGFLASSKKEWMDSIERFISSPELAVKMGGAGYSKVKSKYCLQVTASKFYNVIMNTGI